MRFTIITPSYNAAKTLAQTLDSVAEQDYPDVEHLLIDGGSTDRTVEIARNYPHLTRIVSEPDDGLYHAVNKGIALASGDIVGILNADDVYAHPQVLRRVAGLLRESGADALYGDLEYVASNDPARRIRYWKSGHSSRGKILRGWMPPHPTFFVRREHYERLGRYDPTLHISADYELMLRFLLVHNISRCYLPEVLVRMRTGGLSNAGLRNRLQAFREDRLAWQRNGLRPGIFTLAWKRVRKLGQYRF